MKQPGFNGKYPRDFFVAQFCLELLFEGFFTMTRNVLLRFFHRESRPRIFGKKTPQVKFKKWVDVFLGLHPLKTNSDVGWNIT